MSCVLMDTDLAIDYLRGEPAAVAFVQKHEKEISLSGVTVADLRAGVRQGDEMLKLEEFIRLFPVIPVDFETAKTVGLHSSRLWAVPRHGAGRWDDSGGRPSRVDLEHVEHRPLADVPSPSPTVRAAFLLDLPRASGAKRTVYPVMRRRGLPVTDLDGTLLGAENRRCRRRLTCSTPWTWTSSCTD